MREQLMWLNAETVTHRRRRLDTVIALLGACTDDAHYDGSRVVAGVRGRGGIYVTGHPDQASARAYLRRVDGPERVRCFLDLDRGGIQLVG